MKSLCEHLEQQLNESMGLGLYALIVAGAFCIPNGVYAIYQLIKRAGTKGAYDELMSVLDKKTQDEIKTLKDINLDEFPECKRLVDALQTNMPYKELEELYDNARGEVIRSLSVKKETVNKRKAIEKVLNLHNEKNKAKEDRRIKWFISPVEFLSAFSEGTKSGSRKPHIGGFGGSFGGGSTMGGGAGDKW